jgi:hypothetical protein
MSRRTGRLHGPVECAGESHRHRASYAPQPILSNEQLECNKGDVNYYLGENGFPFFSAKAGMGAGVGISRDGGKSDQNQVIIPLPRYMSRLMKAQA